MRDRPLTPHEWFGAIVLIGGTIIALLVAAFDILSA